MLSKQQTFIRFNINCARENFSSTANASFVTLTSTVFGALNLVSKNFEKKKRKKETQAEGRRERKVYKM